MDDILRKVFIMDIKKYNPTKPKVMFNDLVNDDIQLNIAKGVIEQYRKARKHCYETFGKTEAWGLLPDYRRTCIEDVMPDIAARMGDDCTAKPIRNKAKNCYHRLVLAKSNNGINVAFTQSKVENKELLPRDAEFRKGYAKDPQMVMDFMEEDNTSESNDEVILYAIITHMPDPANEKTPLFIDIVFPNKAYNEILGRIELLNKFPNVLVKEEHEEIADNTEIPIAPSIGIKKQA